MLIFFLLVTFPLASSFSAQSLILDTEYRLRGLSYPNLDFDVSTSTDARAYYTQRLNVTLTGKFAPQTEITVKFQAIGVVGSSTVPTDFVWQQNYPYNNTNFIPFIENAYVNIKKFGKQPVELSIGRQPMEYGGEGLIISDNGAGMNALKLSMYYPYELHAELFTVKLKENYVEAKDSDFHGIVAKYPFKKFKLEFGYYDFRDFSGSAYTQGLRTANTLSRNKTFYDFRFYNSGNWGNYSVEYVFQRGKIRPVYGNNVELNARAFIAKGRLVNEKTRLGKVSGFGILAASTGNRKVGITPAVGEWHTTDEEFSPEFTRKYDGLMRTGWGGFYAVGVMDSFFDVPTEKAIKVPNYSGFGTFGLGMDFSPWYGWTFGFAGYYYNAGTSFNQAAPAISGGFASSGSGIETLSALLIAEDITTAKRYNLGAELDMFASYVHSKLLQFKLGYSRYTPPSFSLVWPKVSSIDQFFFETTCRF